MARPSIATPCPAPYGLSSLPVPAGGRRLSSLTTMNFEDDATCTGDIDYTRAIHQEFKNAKPKRRSTFQRKADQKAAITIFEDVHEDQELVVEPKLGGNTLLGKPAQRIRGQVAPKLQVEPVAENPQPLKAIGQARRRTSVVPMRAAILEDETKRLDLPVVAQNLPEETTIGLKKEPRRRTIFVPSDDTSVFTIHPGAHATDLLNDTFQLPYLGGKPFTSVAPTTSARSDEYQPPSRRPRKSLAAAPKRIPLQQVIKDNNASGMDVAGHNGGKENLPPINGVSQKGPEKIKIETAASLAQTSHFMSSKLFEPTAASQAKQSVVVRKAAPLPKTSINARKQSPVHSRPFDVHDRSNTAQTRLDPKPWHRIASPQPKQDESTTAAGTASERAPKPVVRRVSPTGKLSRYPVLSEDIAQPELYEDSWLRHQEVSLTEVINQIFADADSKPTDWTPSQKPLRERLIEIYHQSSVTTLHKRLQASLLYGALSRPRDMPSPANPAQDLGLRKRFLGLLLDSYDEDALRAAAEVVFGRQLPRKSISKSESRIAATESLLDPCKNRRALTGFLETFLVECHDVERLDDNSSGGDNFELQRWRKMIIRSLMLIWLLDRAKANEVLDGRLFKISSPRKTSMAMLHALAGMLIPSTGDITRVLRHMDYEVSHVQDPLDEIKYHIENIAVDLRDGVVLTRLTELLLFSFRDRQQVYRDDGASAIIQMPDLTVLESALYDQNDTPHSRILSQHLKLPCIGRAQKLYNVQIALSALGGYGKIGDDIAVDVDADEIVDGHREKTLGLLWLLVSSYGLDQILDWKELVADIKRNAGENADARRLEVDGCGVPLAQQESLLKAWASVYCARDGLRISNLTTSFADGNAYAAIVERFFTYIDTPSKNLTASRTNGERLESRLQAFGCSAAFIKQLASATGTIPSRKTTISNLAFLASRLLPLARHHNSALIIQRTFRGWRSRVTMSQRVVLMRLAQACATVVQTQNQLVKAATVFQRSWRRVVDARIARLNNHVEGFQAVAKAWLERQRTKNAGLGGASVNQSLRVMGGW